MSRRPTSDWLVADICNWSTARQCQRYALYQVLLLYFCGDVLWLLTDILDIGDGVTFSFYSADYLSGISLG